LSFYKINIEMKLRVLLLRSKVTIRSENFLS
jgi:hypothetical protein